MSSTMADSDFEEVQANSSQAVKSKKPMNAHEKASLRELVEKYKEVVESKKTDFGTTGKKQEAWLKITDEFCSISENSKRTVEQLKNTWKNMKQRAKSEISNRKRSLKQTGGGAAPPPLSSETIHVANIIPAQMQPLKNPYDCDKENEPIDLELGGFDEDNLLYRKDDEDNLLNRKDNEDEPQTKRKKSSEKGRSQKDARSSLVDMENEEHKIRMEILRIEKMTAEATLTKVQTELSKFLEEHGLRMELLKCQLNAATGQVPQQPGSRCNCTDCNEHNGCA